MCFEEAFLDEEDITEVADVPVHPKSQTRTIHEKVKNICTQIQGLKFHDLTADMAPHHLEEWKLMIKRMEYISIKCKEKEICNSHCTCYTKYT